MKERSKEKREARRIFDKLFMGAVFCGTGKHVVGYLTNKLKPEEREMLKHLKAEDINDSQM
jgi:hypothetical protein